MVLLGIAVGVGLISAGYAGAWFGGHTVKTNPDADIASWIGMAVTVPIVAVLVIAIVAGLDWLAHHLAWVS
jgi:hypothetical protein